eukprot:12698771-Alexandrium_andersonii.AAC.1
MGGGGTREPIEPPHRRGRGAGCKRPATGRWQPRSARVRDRARDAAKGLARGRARLPPLLLTLQQLQTPLR